MIILVVKLSEKGNALVIIKIYFYSFNKSIIARVRCRTHYKSFCLAMPEIQIRYDFDSHLILHPLWTTNYQDEVSHAVNKPSTEFKYS